MPSIKQKPTVEEVITTPDLDACFQLEMDTRRNDSYHRVLFHQAWHGNITLTEDKRLEGLQYLWSNFIKGYEGVREPYIKSLRAPNGIIEGYARWHTSNVMTKAVPKEPMTWRLAIKNPREALTIMGYEAIRKIFPDDKEIKEVRVLNRVTLKQEDLDKKRDLIKESMPPEVCHPNGKEKECVFVRVEPDEMGWYSGDDGPFPCMELARMEVKGRLFHCMVFVPDDAKIKRTFKGTIYVEQNEIKWRDEEEDS